MSLSELASFAISGAAASALSALAIGRVRPSRALDDASDASVEAAVPPAAPVPTAPEATATEAAAPEAAAAKVAATEAAAAEAAATDISTPVAKAPETTAKMTMKTTAKTKYQTATETTHTADAATGGLIFFFSYYVAATAGARLTGSYGASSSTAAARRAAAQAFFIGATAAACTRLLMPVLSSTYEEEDDCDDNEKTQQGVAARPSHWPPPSALAGLRDEAVLVLDPALTFCLHEVLARVVEQWRWRRYSKTGAGPRRSGLAGGASAVATTFVLAATSKAVAAGITYPLRAVGRPTPRRPRRPRLAADLASLQVLGGAWLRVSATAALGHGLTMALQRVLFGAVLRLMYAVAGALRAQRRRLADEPAAASGVLEQTKAAKAALPLEAAVPEHELLPEMPTSPAAASQPPEPAAMPLDEQHQVAKAVESWLETTSTTAVSTPAPAVSAVPAVLATPAAPAVPAVPAALSLPPPPRAETNSAMLDADTAAVVLQQQPHLQEPPQPWPSLAGSSSIAPAEPKDALPPSREAVLRAPEPRRPTWPASDSHHQPTASMISMTSMAPTAAAPMHAQSAAGDSRSIAGDIDSLDGNVVFNMISRRPRVVKRFE